MGEVMDCDDNVMPSGEEVMDYNDDVTPSGEEVMECNDNVIPSGEEAMEVADNLGDVSNNRDDRVMEATTHIVRTPDLFAMKMNELAALFSKLTV